MDAKPEYMYASLSRVRHSAGWREQGTLKLLHGVSCNPQLWHSVVVNVTRAKDGVITMMVAVDDRTRADFVLPDDWFVPSGSMIGVATYSTLGLEARSRFRNLRVSGSALSAGTAALMPKTVPAAATIDAAFSSTGVGNIVSMGGTLFVTNCGSDAVPPAIFKMQCWLLRAPITSDHTPVWSRDAKPLPEAWLSAAIDHGVALRSSNSTKQLEAYFVLSAQALFIVGRATSADGIHWSKPQVVWRSDQAILPESPAETAALSLKPFSALASCSVLELRYSVTAPEQASEPHLLMFLQFTTNGTSETRVDPVTGVKVFSRRKPPGTTSFTVRSTDGYVIIIVAVELSARGLTDVCVIAEARAFRPCRRSTAPHAARGWSPRSSLR